MLTVHAAMAELANGKHEIEIVFEARPFGHLLLKIEDAIGEQTTDPVRLPATMPMVMAPKSSKNGEPLLNNEAAST